MSHFQKFENTEEHPDDTESELDEHLIGTKQNNQNKLSMFGPGNHEDHLYVMTIPHHLAFFPKEIF